MMLFMQKCPKIRRVNSLCFIKFRSKKTAVNRGFAFEIIAYFFSGVAAGVAVAGAAGASLFSST